MSSTTATKKSLTVGYWSWSDNASNITCCLHWLPIKQRIHLKMGLFAFRARHTMLPSYLQDILLNYQPVRQLRSSIPLTSYTGQLVTFTFAPRAFSVSIPFVRNSFNPGLCSINTLGSFHICAKDHTVPCGIR